MRQTGLSLLELEVELHSLIGHYDLPSCLLANEIGGIATDPNDSDNVSATEELIRLIFSDARDDVRCVAYYYLKILSGKTGSPAVRGMSIVEAVSWFERFAKNEQLVKTVREKYPELF